MHTIPKHVAFIMDGNRRWAKEHTLSLFLGHENGARRIEPLVMHAMEKGITHMTFCAFSSENWNRSEGEVATLMEVFRKALRDPMVKRLQERNVRVHVIGDLTQFPQDIQRDVQKILEDSKQNTKMIVNIALNYGGRAEILHAVNELVRERLGVISDNSVRNEKEFRIKPITEEEFGNHLYSAGQPDPDLIIRTGGEKRLSGYLSWQSVYSELYFTTTFWPDFDETAFDLALEDYTQRQRRFGK